jgi:EAL domain-containing protein (putative c-di-GMP-specific phosphodiesterase class I)
MRSSLAADPAAEETAVDDDELKSWLEQLGVDYAQGFVLHHPAPIDELLRTASPADVA